MKKNIQTLGLVGLLFSANGCHGQYSSYLEGDIDHERVRVIVENTYEQPTMVATMLITPLSGEGSGRTYFDYNGDGLVDYIKICKSGASCHDKDSITFSRYQSGNDKYGVLIINNDDRMIIDAAQNDYVKKRTQLKGKMEEAKLIQERKQITEFREQQVKDALKLIEGK